MRNAIASLTVVVALVSSVFLAQPASGNSEASRGSVAPEEISSPPIFMIGVYGDAAGTVGTLFPSLLASFDIYVVLFVEDTAAAAAYKLNLPANVVVLARSSGPSGNGLVIDEPTGTNVALNECAIGFGGQPILVDKYTCILTAPPVGPLSVSVSANTNQDPTNPVYVTCNDLTKPLSLGPSLTLIGPTSELQLLALNDIQQSQGVDELVRIPSPATGVGELVGSLGDHFIETEAMAARLQRQDECLLECGPAEDEIYAVDNDRLLQLDIATGAGIEIGPIGYTDVDGIAFNPTNGLLYGVTHTSNQIVQISVVTGAGSEVASDVIVGRRLEDIAFHPNGDAYILTSGPRIYRVDLQTGAKLAKWELSGGTSLESLIWSPDGQTLYSAADRNGTKDLVTISLSTVDETGTITFVSNQSSGYVDIEALVFVGEESIGILQSVYQGTPSDTNGRLPRQAQLHQNTPNPFNPSTRIQFELARPGHVELTVFDAAGRKVVSLLSASRDAGTHSVQWDGRTQSGALAAAGVYHYVLQSAAGTESRRMVLVK